MPMTPGLEEELDDGMLSGTRRWNCCGHSGDHHRHWGVLHHVEAISETVTWSLEDSEAPHGRCADFRSTHPGVAHERQ